MEKQSVLDDAYFKLVEKRSVFHGVLCHLESPNQFKELREKVEDKFKSSTHVTYAYVCGNETKASDDKEPSGTAGVQILNQIQKNNLCDVVLFVVRYFGGVKLGKKGLADAYLECAKRTIENARFVTKKTVVCIRFLPDVQNYGKAISKVANLGGKFETKENEILALFVGKNKDVVCAEIKKLGEIIDVREEEKWQQ